MGLSKTQIKFLETNYYTRLKINDGKIIFNQSQFNKRIPFDTKKISSEKCEVLINIEDLLKYKFKKDKQKVVLEHSSFNPTGPISIGRFRNSLIGNVIQKSLNCETRYYLNDLGNQVITATPYWTNTKKIGGKGICYLKKTLLKNLPGKNN